jgi:flagellar motor switch protein FliN/FliY
MAEDDKEPKKGRDVSPLALDEIEGDNRSKKNDAEDDGWDDPPADIPDKPRSAQDLEAVYDIPVRVSAVLGKSSMQVNELLKLGRGAVVELDRKVGEAIDIYVNDRLVARGEVVVVDDRLGITMTEIIKTQKN